MNNIIEVKNLTKNYKELKAIDDLSFVVHQGEILGFSSKLLLFVLFL